MNVALFVRLTFVPLNINAIRYLVNSQRKQNVDLLSVRPEASAPASRGVDRRARALTDVKAIGNSAQKPAGVSHAVLRRAALSFIPGA